MTQEQWLVYLWAIYPSGQFMAIWILLLSITVFILLMSFISFGADDALYKSDEVQKSYLWKKLGWYKVTIPSILVLLMFLSYLVPKKEYFAYIVATPYVVDSGKSIIETLDDPNSKLSKLNKIMDKGLDKVLLELESNDGKDNKN